MPDMPEFTQMEGMTPDQWTLFRAEYGKVRKDLATALLLAFFLGNFGAHQFYLGEMTGGFVYLAFFWTGIPGLVALIECFFLSDWVGEYNASHAAAIANQIRQSAIASS